MDNDKENKSQLKDEPAKPAAIGEIFEEEVVSMPNKKSKPEAVRSAPPKKKDDKLVEDLKKEEEEKKKAKEKEEKAKKEKKDKSDSYSDEWGDNDFDLEDKGDKKPVAEEPKKADDFFNV